MLDLPKPLQPDKGDLNGSCNRVCCQRPGAVYFNKYTKRHYCRACAERINRDNGDVICTLAEPNPPAVNPFENPYSDCEGYGECDTHDDDGNETTEPCYRRKGSGIELGEIA